MDFVMAPKATDLEAPDAVAGRLLARLPDTVEVRAAAPGDHPLFPDEAACIERAVEKRRLEYATGRWLARDALAAFDVPARSLLSLPNRAPDWPDGIVGSITHCDGLVCVLVARAGDLRSIGIDAERAGRLNEALFSRILTERELRALRDLGDAERRRRATLMFCAKETVHKNVSPGWELNLAFQDVSIELASGGNRGDGSFRVLPESTGAQAVPWSDFHGALLEAGGIAVAFGWIG